MQRKQPQPKQLAVAVFAALVSMSALPAFAQDAAPAPQAQEEAKTLDTIVVTAQKREEAMQDVPIVVTSLSQQVLQDTGVRDIKDMQVLVPGLTVTSTQNEAITTARIRGIGTVGDNMGLESSVGVVIDGVYRPRNSVGFGDLGELERIEVLKGPQGTLFGKNTSAGVINVVTRRPDHELGGEVDVVEQPQQPRALESALDAVLDVDAERLLQRDDVLGVGDGHVHVADGDPASGAVERVGEGEQRQLTATGPAREPGDHGSCGDRDVGGPKTDN